MADGVLLPNGEQQFFDLTGAPLAGGLVHTYVPGTTTPKTTWVDQGETTANTNPIVLDSLGRCVIWGSGTYRQLVTDSVGNLIWDALTSDGGLATVQGDITTLQSDVDQLQTDVTDLQTTVNKVPGWLKKTLAPTSNHLATVTDSGTLFNSGNSVGSLVITLPNTTTLDIGWYCAFVREASNITINVEGSRGEFIAGPGFSATSISLAPQDGETLLLSYDGANFVVIAASPDTQQALGAQRMHLRQFGVGATSFLIPAAQLRYRLVGGGGGGASGTASLGGGAGAGGAYVEGILSGLTIGASLLISVGAGGAGGAAGGNDGIVGGPTTIGTVSTTFATAGGGGHGAINGTGGFGGLAAGGDVNVNGNQGTAGFGATPGSSGGAGAIGSAGAGGVGTGAAPTSTVAQAGQPGTGILEWFA